MQGEWEGSMGAEEVVKSGDGPCRRTKGNISVPTLDSFRPHFFPSKNHLCSFIMKGGTQESLGLGLV